MHITLLHFQSECPIYELSKSIEATYNVVSKFHPFLVSINKITSFSKNPEGYVAIIGKVESDELMKLRKKLTDNFNEKIDFSKTFKDYKPHVFLLKNT